MFLYVFKQTFRKVYGYITREFLGLRIRNFQGIIFLWTRTYREIFKSALVYLLFLVFIYFQLSALSQPKVVECKFTFADLQRLMRLMKNECLNSTKNYRPGNKIDFSLKFFSSDWRSEKLLQTCGLNLIITKRKNKLQQKYHVYVRFSFY